MDDIAYDPQVLWFSEIAWREQANSVQVATENIWRAPLGGFDEEAVDAVSAFWHTWAKVADDISKRANDTADHLTAAVKAITEFDTRAQEEFQAWLGSET